MAVLAVAAGTAMTVSVPVLYGSTRASVEDFSRAIAGPSEFRVVGAVRRGGVGPETVAAIEDTAGVAEAVPIVQAVTLAAPSPSAVQRPVGQEGRPVLAFGVDCHVEALVGPFGCDTDLPPDDDAALHPLLVGPGLENERVLRTNRQNVLLGEAVRVDPDAPGRLGVDLRSDGASGLLAGDIGSGRYVVFHLSAAQRLFDRGDAVDVVYVVPEPGQDAASLREDLEQAVGPQHPVLDAEEGPPEIADAVADVVPLFSLLALFSLGTGAMLVYNTVTLTVERRRREYTVAGALGAAPRLVRTVTLLDAALVGLVGGLLGVGLGILAAVPIVANLSQYTERVTGIPLEVTVSPLVPAGGALLGTLVAVVAALPGAARAARFDVARELSGRGRQAEDRAPRSLRRAVLWLLVAGAGLGAVALARQGGGLSPWQVPVGGLGFAVSAVALLLAGANLVPVLARPFQRPARAWAPARLALNNVVRPAGRTGLMTAALTAAVTTAVLANSYGSGFREALTRGVEDRMDGVEVSSVGAGPNVNLDAGLSPGVLEALPEVPGVATVHRGVAVLASSQDGPSLLVSAHQRPWSTERREAVRGHLDRAGFDAGEVVISASLARSTGLRPGDKIELPTPQGLVERTVQAVVHGQGTGEGRVFTAYGPHVEMYGDQPVRSVYVEADDGVTPAQLAERLRAADLGQVRIQTPAQVVAETEQAVDRQMVPFFTFQRSLLAVAFVAVFSTMVLVGVQRQREMALLVASGAGPGLLYRMVLVEAAVVALAASLLSVAIGLPLLWAMTRLSPLTTGLPVPFDIDWWSVPVAGGAALVVALLAAVWPARRAATVNVIATLRSE